MRAISSLVEVAERIIDPRMVLFAILSGLVLAAVAFSFLALFRAQALVRDANHRANASRERCEAHLELLQESHNSLAAEVREIKHEPSINVLPFLPKPGLNLTKRSQALRMHRRGDPPDRIAAALDIPFQEVNLLLKVHRIVMTHI